MSAIINQAGTTFRWVLRDRLLHTILSVDLFLFILVPILSNFSMRQVQELSITLSLSAISLTLLVLSILLGAASVWRDVERRYTASVLSLPIHRSTYVLGKFFGASFIIVVCTAIMALFSLMVIMVSSAHYPSDIPVHWLNIILAISANCLKYILLTAVALLFSCLSTSFFLPFFGTISIFLAGSASQGVYEYISGEFGRTLSIPGKYLIKGVYYVIPNFSAFDLQVNAVYGLAIPIKGLIYSSLYFLIYTSIILVISVWVFARREMP